MSLLAANLEVLRTFDPVLAGRLVSLQATSERGTWTLSRSGAPTVRLGGISLASAFDPVSEAARAVPEWGQEVDFVVLPGLGAGYLAEAVSNRYPDLPVLVAEPDQLWLLEVLSHRDLASLWPRIVLLAGAATALGDYLGSLACPNVQILPWRPLDEQNPEWHRAVVSQVSSAQARSRVNLATYRRFGALWRRNLHRNEASGVEVRPLEALRNLELGFPAVIAAAGPSLGSTVPWMRLHRDRFVLIAVDTAWPALALWGMEPDYLVILDGQYWNARHIDKQPPERTRVVTEWTAPPRAFRLAPGRTFVAATGVAFLRSREESLWGRLGPLASGGSVATASWSLALHLGCSSVTFAGLDLGYPEGQTHAAGSQFEEALHRRSRRLAPAETQGLLLRGLAGLEYRPSVGGGRVLSDAKMDLFREWLVRAVKAHPKVDAFNLGTTGSLIDGLRFPPDRFGIDWPVIPRPASTASPLARNPATPQFPPFDLLGQVLQAPDFSQAVERAWHAAIGFWGQEVWEAWAGRAYKTWKRFPSERSRRAVVEVVELAVGWKEFWAQE